MTKKKTKCYCNRCTPCLNQAKRMLARMRRSAWHWSGFKWSDPRLDEFIKMLEDLDYGCAFKQKTVSGRGGRHQIYVCRGGDPNCGCCGGCIGSYGYHHGYITPELEGLKILWNNLKQKTPITNGYWQMGVGCTLPRRYRSFVCTHCVCMGDNKSIDFPILGGLIDLRNPYHYKNKGKFGEARQRAIKLLALYKEHRRKHPKKEVRTIDR